MKKQTKLDRISHDIYEYLKTWLNPDVMVPGFVYNDIRKIVDKIENPPKKSIKKESKKLENKSIDKQTQGWINVIRNLK